MTPMYTRPPASAAARRRRPRGLSLVELLISLAISAMLLTAVATSYTASANAIRANDEFFRATQAARVSMNQILAAVRKCDTCKVGSTAEHNAAAASITTAKPIASVVDKSVLEVITADVPAKDLTYQFDSATRALKLITNTDATDQDYTLARNIESCAFTSDLEVIAGITYVTRVTVTLNVVVGTNNVRLSGSAVPRRTMKY